MFTILENLELAADKVPQNINQSLAFIIAERLGVSPLKLVNYRILRCATDSRKQRTNLIYKILVELSGTDSAYSKLKCCSPDELQNLAVSIPEIPENIAKFTPVIVGTGPAGLFAGLLLAEAGAPPVIIERGPEADERYANHQSFLNTRKLNKDSNLLIGEGGAGTFSDGKLYTGTTSTYARWILQTLVEHGAAPEITYLSRPHVGSDKLRLICPAIRKKIEALGGEFRFKTTVAEILLDNNRICGVQLSSGEKIYSPAVLIAPGLGGKNLVKKLCRIVDVSPKPFQIGCRIEHPQEFIDSCQYHSRKPAVLGAAEYHLVSKPRNAHELGVASFCMCPGGTIVNATAQDRHSTTNGMSNFARDGKFANGCLITTLSPEYFKDIDTACQLTDSLSEQLFSAGGSDYTLPAQDAAAFLKGLDMLSNTAGNVETGVTRQRIDALLPEIIVSNLRRAIQDFDKRLPGFIKYGRLVGIECGVSAPWRFMRNPETLASSINGLWLAGEGVGAAGGIMSAAVDGVRCAQAMLKFTK